jgi:hypothetical protein
LHFSQNQVCISDSDSEDKGYAGIKRQRKDKYDDIVPCKEDELQIKNDEEIAIALQNELDKEEDFFTKECQVILALEKKVIGRWYRFIIYSHLKKHTFGKEAKSLEKCNQ